MFLGGVTKILGCGWQIFWGLVWQNILGDEVAKFGWGQLGIREPEKNL